MLSILLPVYRYDVSSLVKELHRQALQLSIAWEIYLLDDASDPAWQAKNRALGELENVHYEELPKNAGRARIRNLLAARARHDYLLFLDSDSGIPSPDFLSNYQQQLRPECVLCGGRQYADQPAAPEFHLHWWYGREREVTTASTRNRTPYAGFMTNNFLVPKTVLQRVPFDETILTYGHEDTLFGHQLQLAQVEILHLDNPVIHVGLDEAASWLGKQRQAIENLHRLSQQYPGLETRALRWWRRLRATGITILLYPLLRAITSRVEKNLLSTQRSNLRQLDLLKIYWLETVAREASSTR